MYTQKIYKSLQTKQG